MYLLQIEWKLKLQKTIHSDKIQFFFMYFSRINKYNGEWRNIRVRFHLQNFYNIFFSLQHSFPLWLSSSSFFCFPSSCPFLFAVDFTFCLFHLFLISPYTKTQCSKLKHTETKQWNIPSTIRKE